jgi:hypothetical protein
VSHIFISYKREDEVRVARLAQQLETALAGDGIAVWWDLALPGAENWREHIDVRLDTAAAVVVVWSAASVSREGGCARRGRAGACARRFGAGGA